MLEHSPLLVHGWTRKTLADAGAAWVRPITDASSRSLGFVRLDGDASVSWLSWLKKVRLEVFETEDASHLATLTRSWGVLNRWEIADAEGRHVGNLFTKTIVTSERVRLGYLDRGFDGQGRVIDEQGRVQARFVKKDATILEVTFAAESSPNPFVRMLILGSILTLEPMPPLAV